MIIWNRHMEKSKICYMDTDSCIVCIKTNDIAKDFEARFDSSKYELERPLHTGKHWKVIGLMKNELGREIMKDLAGLRAKTYSYLMDSNDENKKAKPTKGVS